MCDCYCHKCSVCDDTIEVHIGDYNFPREAVEAWCPKHIPVDEPGVEVFEIAEDDPDFNGGLRKGTKLALRLDKGTLRPSEEDVHPNYGEAVEIAWEGPK